MAIEILVILALPLLFGLGLYALIQREADDRQVTDRRTAEQIARQDTDGSAVRDRETTDKWGK